MSSSLQIFRFFGGLFLFVSLLAVSGCSQIFPDSSGLVPDERKEPFVPSARYYYLTSQMLFAKGEYDQAEIALKKALKKNPESSFLKRSMILLYLAQEREELAMELTQSLVSEHPDDVNNLLLLLKFIKDQESPELTVLLRRILELAPKNKEAYLRLGKIYMEKPDYTRAGTLFSRMVKEFPMDYVAWFYLGDASLKNEELPRARQAFMKSIELEPQLLEARFRLAELTRREQGKHLYRQLMDIYAQILEIDPKNHLAKTEMALLHFHQKNTAQATQLFDEIIETLQTDPRLLMLTADYFITANRARDGVNIFSRLLSTNKDNDLILFFTGMIYEASKDIPAALKCYRKISHSLPQYKKVLLNIALLYRDMQQPENAIRFLESRHRKHPEDADIILYLISFYQTNGQMDQALNLAKDSVQKNPENTSFLFKLGELYDKTQNRQESIRIMKQIISLDPEDANALNYLGYTYAEMGQNLDQALDLVTRALAIKPEDGYIMDSLGWVYFQQGDYTNALIHLEKAARLTNFEPIIADHLAQTYLKIHKPDMAIAVYEKSINFAARNNKPKEINDLRRKIQAIKLRTGPTP